MAHNLYHGIGGKQLDRNFIGVASPFFVRCEAVVENMETRDAELTIAFEIFCKVGGG